MTVYLVFSSYPHEGSLLKAAYQSKESAQEWVKETYPEHTQMGDTSWIEDNWGERIEIVEREVRP